MKRLRGFTYIELMMTLAIVGLLALVAVPAAQVVAQRQKEHELRIALVRIREAIDAFKRASEQGRIALKTGASGYPPTLQALVEGVVDQRSPAAQKLYFLRRLPANPFHDGAAEAAISWGLRSSVSPPDEPAPGADVFDVYCDSAKAGLDGVPYRAW